MNWTRRAALALPLLGWLGARFPALAQISPRKRAPGDTDWTSYAGSAANTRYSPLDQVNGKNFNELEIAWRFKTDILGVRPEYQFESTPLVVNGVLYSTAGSRRDVIALDAATGELLWIHREDEGERARRAPRQLSGRGLSYWTDGTEERLLYVTIGYRLIALDIRTGQRIAGFGTDGVIDLRQDDDQQIDPVTADVGLNATPCVVKDTVIVGAAHTAGNVPLTRDNVRGYVRGFDVRTGKRKWIFHTIPRKGEFGYDTWLDGTEKIGNAGVWSQMSADPELNLVYIGVELPTGDVGGQYRRGNGLFGESIVALDIDTGVRKWHYQTVHHGLWDYDIPAAPVLLDVPVKGKGVVKLLAAPTKQSFLYVLDRVTGKPVWPIPERKVPKGDVPGEWYSPTQPIPTKPKAYDVQGITPDVLIDFTPELHAQALEVIKNYRTGPLFTPASVFDPEGTWGTLTAPSLTGGSNWPGGAADPETGIIYVCSKTQADVMTELKNDNPKLSDFAWINVRGMAKAPKRGTHTYGYLTVEGLPLLKPPYERITAIDLKTGDFVWQVPHGETPDQIRNHPKLKGLKIPKTGRPGNIGALVTKTLVIAGEAGIFTLPDGRRGAMLCAYDKATGEQKGAVYMPAGQSGCPMTYMLNGRQHIVIAVGGGNYSGELIAYRLSSA
ncbi:outer membrane protein assembly factor BamB family protein [Sphingomonas nostoxanthinifaciens]|uniref:outer membrane protein assembly factor BamB family protein n=1 Tax=Sphingomonas nostoxanthinifaciens TaxID=2872652 RepID=UPI001CC211F5|nr:PQQ-binding-like beta-propeller repeat protein [Sphingomonas nostoxanthinifaciens]UAK23274.1 PQQ-binding-like beta-propeller repeat protein [Sphingomonas nostoxanthinifaciens]